MATLETGLWFLLIAVASAFTFLAFAHLRGFGGFLHIIAMVIWLGLSGIHGAGFEVSAFTNATYNDGTTTWIEERHDVMIPGGEDAFWLSYLFLGFAIVNIFLFVKDIWRPT